MDVKEIFLEHNMRLTPEAEEYLKNLTIDEVKDIVLTLMEEKKVFVELDDLKKEEKEKITVIRSTFKEIEAREYSSNFKIHWERDITNKSRSKGKIEDFVENVRDKYKKLSSIVRTKMTTYQNVSFKKINGGGMESEKVRVIVIVSDKRTTQKGNLLLEVEDESDTGIIIISDKETKLFDEAQMISNDSVIGIEGSIFKNMVIAERIVWPDIPVNHKLEPLKENLSIMYISDTHIGSNLFLDKPFEKMIDWLKEGGEQASRVKYMCIAGDVVDGVGIYPGQEKELVVKDIYEQYDIFGKYMEQIPEYIEIFIIPGNHDAVRRAQPQPKIPKELINLNGRVHLLGDPAWVTIEKYLHLLYHGDALDSVIASLPGLDYKQPEKAMVELLKRRHLSPIYGTNPIVPETTDYLVIDEVPEVVCMGHLHKNGVSKYRNVFNINAGTFQLKTEYQAKFGHVPTPGIATLFNMDSLNISHVKFYEGEV